ATRVSLRARSFPTPKEDEMASLMRKVFETMPLAGVESALFKTKKNWNAIKLGDLAGRIKAYSDLDSHALSSKPPDDYYPDLHLKQGHFYPEVVALWGCTIDKDPSVVRDINCRVAMDKYSNYRVLDKLTWGYADTADPLKFKKAIRVTFGATPIELELIER